MSTERANPLAGLTDDLDLSDFAPREAPTQVDKAAIKEVAEASKFVSREQKAGRAGPAPKLAASTVSTPIVKKRDRRRTGRTYPFGTKITPECYNAWVEMADGSGKPLGELMEIAIPLLRVELERQKKG